MQNRSRMSRSTRRSSSRRSSSRRSGSRKSGLRIFSRLYSPLSHLLRAGKKSVNAVTNTTKGVIGKGLNGVDRVGKGLTSEMNGAVRNLTRSRKSRKTRKNTRRNRKH